MQIIIKNIFLSLIFHEKTFSCFFFFSTFDTEKIKCLKISKIAKFEGDLLKTNEDIAPQGCKTLQKFVWWGAQTCPTYHFQI